MSGISPTSIVCPYCHDPVDWFHSGVAHKCRLNYMDLARKAAALLPRDRDQGEGVKVEINVPPLEATGDTK